MVPSEFKSIVSIIPVLTDYEKIENSSKAWKKKSRLKFWTVQLLILKK